VDPRLARDADELRPEDLVPQALDRLDLGEEAVPADVEAIALVARVCEMPPSMSVPSSTVTRAPACCSR
jgi:hypothetical protein